MNKSFSFRLMSKEGLEVLMGIGVVHLWGCGFVAWAAWSNSEIAWVKVVGLIALAFVSATCISLLSYMDRLNGSILRLEEDVALWKGQPNYWQEQAQIAFRLLEIEQKKNKTL